MCGSRTPRTAPGIGRAILASGASFAMPPAPPGSPKPPMRGTYWALPYSEPTRRTQPFCVIQRPLDERGPPIDELLLAARPNRPLARAVGLACHLHLLSPPCARSEEERALNLSTDEHNASYLSPVRTSENAPSTSFGE